MYIAAVLDQASILILRGAVRDAILDAICVDIEAEGFKFETPAGGPLPHHMTINMGEFDETLNKRSILGKPVEIGVDYVFYDPVLGVCAVTVDECEAGEYPDSNEVHSANARPHITVALKPGVKPKTSNELFGPRKTTTVKLELGLLLDGTIAVCD